MISPPVRALLDAIGKVEAGKRGYDAIYLPAEITLGQHDLTAMRVVDVQSLQNRMVKVSGSSAVGRYQFIRATLSGLVKELGLSGKERFNEALQDRLAVQLLNRRGMLDFLAGRISREQFANNLAREWASLPVVTPVDGKRVGQSYYAGDGLNQALMTPETILSVLDGLRASQELVEPPKPVPPVSVPTKPEKPASGPEKPGKPKLTRWQAFWLSVTGAAAGASAWISENTEIVFGILAVAALAGAFIIWRKRK